MNTSHFGAFIVGRRRHGIVLLLFILCDLACPGCIHIRATIHLLEFGISANLTRCHCIIYYLVAISDIIYTWIHYGHKHHSSKQRTQFHKCPYLYTHTTTATLHVPKHIHTHRHTFYMAKEISDLLVCHSY